MKSTRATMRLLALLVALLSAVWLVAGCEDEPTAPEAGRMDQPEAGQVGTAEPAEPSPLAETERMQERGELPTLGYLEEEDGQLTASMTFTSTAGEGGLHIERVGSAEVRSGALYEYEIRVTNNAQYIMQNVVLHEMVTGNFQLDRASPQPQSRPLQTGQSQRQQQTQQGQQPMQPGQVQPLEPTDQQGQAQQQQPGQMRQQAQQAQAEPAVHTWRIGTLMPGESQVIRVSGTVSGADEFTSCIAASFEPTMCLAVGIVEPELVLRREIVDAEGNILDEAYICEDLFVWYQVTNTGDAASEPVTLYEELPQGITTEDGQNVVQLEVGALDPGESAEQTVPLDPQAGGEFTGRARARTESIEVLSDPSSVTLLQPDLQLDVAGPRQEYIGRAVTYRISLRNPSDDPAIGVVLRMDLPEGIRNVSVAGREVDRDANLIRVGDLPAGESRSFDITFEARQPTTLQAAFAAEALCVAEKTASVTTELVGVPAILIEVVDRVDPVTVGDETIYELRVKNQGTAEDLNVQLQAQLSQGMEFVSAEGETDVQAQDGQLQFAPIDQLAPGDVATWLIRARATSPGSQRLELQMTSDANTQPVIAMEPTTTIGQ